MMVRINVRCDMTNQQFTVNVKKQSCTKQNIADSEQSSHTHGHSHHTSGKFNATVYPRYLGIMIPLYMD